jgi:hypothetical protein
VHGSVFDGVHGQVQIVAPDLDAFLKRLLMDVEAFVRNEEDWKYLV